MSSFPIPSTPEVPAAAETQPSSLSSHSSPFGRGWIPAGRDIGVPAEDCPSAAGLADASPPRPAGGGGVLAPPFWTPARKQAFLAALAEKGNVRLAAAKARVSHESAYRLRRRDTLFAAAWDAALVVARAHAEQVLADRALDGVAEDVWFRGELVGTRRRFDGRLLLAHLARLDRMAEQPFAETRAGRFDELLAQVGGLEFPPELADRDELATEYLADPLLPATRERHTGLALLEAEEEVAQRSWDVEDPDDPVDLDAEPEEEPEPESPEAIVARTQAEWDAWEAAVRARVDGGPAVEAGADEGADEDAPGGAGGAWPEDSAGMGPFEVKSLGGRVLLPWTVSTVSTWRGAAGAARPARMQNGLDSAAHRV